MLLTLLVSACASQAAANATPQDSVQVVQALYAQGRFQEAAAVAERLVRADRDDGEAWIALANVHLAPEWAFRRDARAESAAKRALKLNGRKPLVVMMLATAKHHQAKYDEALPLIAELVDPTPPKVGADAMSDLLVLRADIELRRAAGDAEARTRGLADLDRALAGTPDSTSARLLRADARIQDGRYEEALADLKVALAGAYGNKLVHYQLQTCLSRMGRRDEARRHHEIWKRINRLTDSQGITNAPTTEERLELLRELKELNPGSLIHRLQLAQVELELGAPARSLVECDELLKLAPEWPPAVHLRNEAQKAASLSSQPAGR